MTNVSHLSSSPAVRTFAGLAPVFAITFLGFLAVGVPLAALSLQVRDHFGLGPAAVGCVIGVQSLATVLTRPRAGSLCDNHGARTVVQWGLPLAALSGFLYLLSDLVPGGGTTGFTLLILGRLVMGLSESLFITGAMSWGIGRLGPARTGTVMSWQGIAMYASLGVGAPLGLSLQAMFGFSSVAAVTILAPLVAFSIALALKGIPAFHGERVAFGRIIGLIWRPGLVLALATIPFAAMATFLALDYAAHGWSGAGLALAGFGAAYVVVRLVGSNLPDRFGGIVVASASLAVEAVGQVLIWEAGHPTTAWVGAALTGAGFSLIFPAMGVVATRAVPASQRGRAVGNFIAFFDAALGLTGPAIGMLVGHGKIDAAFLVGAAATGMALVLVSTVARGTGPVAAQTR